MDIIKDEVRDIVSDRLEVPKAPHLKESLLAYDSCFGVLYNKRNKVCQEECTLPVEIDGEKMPCNEACAGVTEKAMQQLQQGGKFVCEPCNKAFGNKGAYIKHMKSVHDKDGDAMTDKLYTCEHCGRQRSYEIVIDMHKALKHGDK